MKNLMHKINNMPLQPSSIFPVLDRWANLLAFPVKSSVYLYSNRKPRACQKLVGGPRVGKCPVPGQRKICKCLTHGTGWQAGQMPHSSRGAGSSWNWLMHYVLHVKQNYILVINYFYLTWEKTTFSHFASVDHIPLKETLPCVNI